MQLYISNYLYINYLLFLVYSMYGKIIKYSVGKINKKKSFCRESIHTIH